MGNDKFRANSKKYSMTILTISILGFFVDSLLVYLSGVRMIGILFAFQSWVIIFLLATLIYKLGLILDSNKKNKLNRILPYLFFFNPILWSVINFIEPTSVEMYYSIGLVINLTLFILVFISLYTQLNILLPSWMDKDMTGKLEGVVNEARTNTSPTVLDNVIFSIEERAEYYEKRRSSSLIAIFVIVIIGGGASFGTVALDEASEIRELESSRRTLMDITEKLSTTGKESGDIIMRNRAIKILINKKYGVDGSYQKTLENLENETRISWPDIAMRITIAALTLFLVQVFFQIYKYSQQQVSHLKSKAEALGLYSDKDVNLDELRSGLLLKLDSSPSFGKESINPTDQVINVLGKLKS